MRPSTLAILLGAGRALLGLAVLVLPGPIVRRWVGTDAVPAQLLGRAVGGRDVALGAGAVLAVARDRDPRPWLAGGVVADLSDAAATLAAGERIPRNGRLGTAALAGASAVLGACLLGALR
jgi:hypothetical protein